MKRHKDFYGFILLILLGTASIFAGCGGGGSSSPAPIAIPAAPIAVSAVAGNSQVVIGWSAVATATSYNIYRSLLSGQTGTQIASVASPSTSYVDTGLTNNTTYYYVVDVVSSAGVIIMSSQVSAIPTDVSFGAIQITGTVQYQDKEYGLNGFTGNTSYKAVRYAAVELVDAITSGVTGTAQTDSNGVYSITTAPTTTVYVRVNAEATLSGSTPQIAVKNLSGHIYAVGSNDFTPSGSANVNISIPTTSVGGAFNILDVFANGFQFVNSLAGTYPLVPLSGYWQTGNANGTYYCSGNCTQGEGIYVLNSSSDTDEYDDDVLYHEFGHFTAALFSKDDSLGGAHSLTDNDLDMRLAWSEGWGDSMPGAVKTWLFNTSQQNLLSSAQGVHLTEYVDTTGSTAGIAIDMDSPDGTYGYNSLYYSYACGEVAIAKILLDLNKDFGMQNVWDVIADFKTNKPSTPVNLELFWDRWHSLPSTSSITIDSIFGNRQIYYSPDNFEPDGSFASAQTYTPGIPQAHTLYGDGDVDYVAFSAVATHHYTITTFNLLNGADTYIELYSSPTQTIPLRSNDNSNGVTYAGSTVPSDIQANQSILCDSYGICHDNGFDILGSTITFTTTSTGMYYVKIYSSPNRPVSAGRYGTYTLKITSP
jgi:hypothetical protein